MESSSTIIAISLILSLSLQITPSNGQYCNSTKFQAPNKKFNECVELAELGSTLHFTYNATNSSLSVAYVGFPEKPDGWVSWAINPNSTGMVGAQAFVAFKSDGKLVVKTYNIKSHAPINESKLSFESWGLAGESEGRTMTIYASMKVANEAVKINHVWNSGASVSDGIPDGHSMDEPHTASLGVLNLVGGNQPPTAAPPAPAAGGEKSGASPGSGLGIGYCLGVVFVLVGGFLGF